MQKTSRFALMLLFGSLALFVSGNPSPTTVEAGVANEIIVDGVTCTLSEAIRSANEATGIGGCKAGVAGQDVLILNTDVTLSAADTTHSSQLSGTFAGLPDITSQISIQAGTGNLIQRDPAFTCEAEDADQFRIFHLTGGGILNLSGMTVQNGCAAPAGETEGRGGAAYVQENSTFNLTNSTLRNHTAYGGGITGSNAYGGAVYAESSTVLFFLRTALENNLARGGDATGIEFGGLSFGGAIDSDGTIYIDETTFSHNTARGGDGVDYFGGHSTGGAIYSSHNIAIIAESAFEHNLARGGNSANNQGGYGEGGAIYRNMSTINTIGDSVFRGNLARGGDSGSTSASDGTGQASGGAIFGFEGSVNEISNTLFEGNQAISGVPSNGASARGARGGAMYDGGNITLMLGVTFANNSALSSDSAGDGQAATAGALYSHGTINILQNSTFVGNVARGASSTGGGNGYAGRGGAIAAFGTIGTFTHNTVTGNHALGGTGAGGNGIAEGGGVYSGNATFILDNSILAGNSATPGGGSLTPNDCDFVTSGVNSAGYNLVENPGSCVFASTGDKTGLEPELGPLADNGCAATLPDGACVPTIALLASSPALDAGSCNISGLSDDQRGEGRPFDATAVPNEDDGCDIGAFELWQQVPANPPTVLAVRTHCDAVELDYLARNTGTLADMVVLVYREEANAGDEVVAQGALPSTGAVERYSERIALRQAYPAGTVFYVEVSAASGTVSTPAQPCTTP